MLAGAELPLLERGARLTNGKPSGGVSGARVAGGRKVQIVRGCTEATEFTVLVEEVRRLVETEGVDAVVGPISEADGLVMRDLARKYPEVIFIPVWSGAQELTLRHPAANVYRFDTDEAQDVAGLGSYAYREMGWRRAAVVADHVRRVAGGSSLRRGVLRPRRERDSALLHADRPWRPEGRPRSPERRRRRRASLGWVLHRVRLSAGARSHGGVARDPARRRHICARGLEYPRAHRPPAGRGRRRVVDPAGRRDTRHAPSPGGVLEGVPRAAALVRGDTGPTRLQRRHGRPAARARRVRG